MLHGFRIIFMLHVVKAGLGVIHLLTLGILSPKVFRIKKDGNSDDGSPNFEERSWRFALCLGGGFKYFLFSPLLGEDSHFE